MKFPEEYRWLDAPHGYTTNAGDPFGAFRIPSTVNTRELTVIACDDAAGNGWEHASVSLARDLDKCPSWYEMCLVKSLFWADDDCVVQFHPPKADYVNMHPGVLHLWHYVGGFPMPPKILV